MRSRIASVVASIAPYDEEERRDIEEVLSWIESGAPLARLSAPADPMQHLISYFAPLDFENRRILLGDHRRASLWLPGGGHLEVDEEPLACALREMREEFGEELPLLSSSPLFLSLCTVEQPAVHTDVALWYLVRGDGVAIPNYDRREFSDMRWFSWDRLPIGRTDQSLARFVEKVEQLGG